MRLSLISEKSGARKEEVEDEDEDEDGNKARHGRKTIECISRVNCFGVLLDTFVGCIWFLDGPALPNPSGWSHISGALCSSSLLQWIPFVLSVATLWRFSM